MSVDRIAHISLESRVKQRHWLDNYYKRGHKTTLTSRGELDVFTKLIAVLNGDNLFAPVEVKLLSSHGGDKRRL